MDEGRCGRLPCDEEGATAVEYAVMLGLIIAVAMVAIGTFGGGVQERWSDSATRIIQAITGAGS